MKKIFTLLLLCTSITIAQSGSLNYEELVKQYPQLSAYKSNKYGTVQKDPSQTTQFDFTDYTDAELLMLDSSVTL